VAGNLIYMYGAVICAEVKTLPISERSSSAAELGALVMAVSHAVLLRGICSEMNLPGSSCPIDIFSDSQVALRNSDRRQITRLSRHVGFKITFINDLREMGVFQGRYIPTKLNPADILSKYVDRLILQKFAKMILKPGHSIVRLVEEGVAGVSGVDDTARMAQAMGIDIGKESTPGESNPHTLTEATKSTSEYHTKPKKSVSIGSVQVRHQ